MSRLNWKKSVKQASAPMSREMVTRDGHTFMLNTSASLGHPTYVETRAGSLLRNPPRKFKGVSRKHRIRARRAEQVSV